MSTAYAVGFDKKLIHYSQANPQISGLELSIDLLQKSPNVMSKNIPYVIPSTPPKVEETFAAYQTTRQFYQEVQTRSEFELYCEWYHRMAEKNRQDLEKMRGEPNIFQWFRRSPKV